MDMGPVKAAISEATSKSNQSKKRKVQAKQIKAKKRKSRRITAASIPMNDTMDAAWVKTRKAIASDYKSYVGKEVEVNIMGEQVSLVVFTNCFIMYRCFISSLLIGTNNAYYDHISLYIGWLGNGTRSADRC